MMIPRSSRSRRGTVLIVVLVCMGVATTILLGAIKMSLHQRRQTRNHLQLEQTKWLLDAGIGQAIGRLKAEQGYTGETIKVSPSLTKYSDATIEIQVAPNESRSQLVEVRIIARIRGDQKYSPTIQRSTTIEIDLSKNNNITK